MHVLKHKNIAAAAASSINPSKVVPPALQQGRRWEGGCGEVWGTVELEKSPLEHLQKRNMLHDKT